jgi:hypothetical protein
MARLVESLDLGQSCLLSFLHLFHGVGQPTFTLPFMVYYLWTVVS